MGSGAAALQGREASLPSDGSRSYGLHTWVFVVGHFGAYEIYTTGYGQEGLIEWLIFANGVVGGGESARRTMASAQRAATSPGAGGRM